MFCLGDGKGDGIPEKDKINFSRLLNFNLMQERQKMRLFKIFLICYLQMNCSSDWCLSLWLWLGRLKLWNEKCHMDLGAIKLFELKLLHRDAKSDSGICHGHCDVRLKVRTRIFSKRKYFVCSSHSELIMLGGEKISEMLLPQTLSIE